MKLVFISGVSGVGKTTICNYIKDNFLLPGYAIFDIDDLENIIEYNENSYSLLYENYIKKAIVNAKGNYLF